MLLVHHTHGHFYEAMTPFCQGSVGISIVFEQLMLYGHGEDWAVISIASDELIGTGTPSPSVQEREIVLPMFRIVDIKDHSRSKVLVQFTCH